MRYAGSEQRLDGRGTGVGRTTTGHPDLNLHSEMSKLEDLRPDTVVGGVVPDGTVIAVNVQWFGPEALDLTSSDLSGRVGNRLLYRHDEPRLEIVRLDRADTITVTKNEILTSLNKPDDYILAIVEFLDDSGHRVHYVRRPFRREPDFGVTSVNYDLRKLLERGKSPL